MKSGTDSMNSPFNLLCGPSHAVRFKHAMKTGQLPNLFSNEQVIGGGGMPIWNPRVSRALTDAEIRPFFIVGDFRFGNRVLKTPKEARSPLGDHRGIEKSLLTKAHDDEMYGIVTGAIEQIIQQFPQARFLFWDLTLREYEARISGRYRTDGVYCHPSWNLDHVLERYAGRAIDTRELLANASACYIDASCHPSLIGWSYIIKHLFGAERDVGLACSIQVFHSEMKALFTKFMAKSGSQHVTITGNSKFTRLLSQFIDRGIIALPDTMSIIPLQTAVSTEGADSCSDCLYFPSIITHQMDAVRLKDGTEKTRRNAEALTQNFKSATVLMYDNWASERISTRADYLDHYVSTLPAGQTAALEQVICPKRQDYRISESDAYSEALIELNNTLLPTPLGILEVLIRGLSGCSHDTIRQEYEALRASVI